MANVGRNDAGAATSSAATLELLSRRTHPAPVHPTRVIQFGEGNFLRGFVEWQLQRMNDQGLFRGGVAIVQPRPGGRVKRLEAQDRLYTVVLEGISGGRPVQEHEVITVVNRTVDPYREWAAFLALADNPDTGLIVSNTTEAGISVPDGDTDPNVPPAGFPAKLALLLHRRFRSGLPGVVVIPCELIEDNGPRLRAAVLESARRFGLERSFLGWVTEQNTFCSSLVDRIVTGYPGDRATALWGEFGYRDHEIVVAEPYHLWVIEGPDDIAGLLPLRRAGLNAVLTDNLRPYRERKVALLNGPHTTLAALGAPAGLHTVGEAMAHPVVRGFIEDQMREEIIPVLSGSATELCDYAHQILQRFDNPFLSHPLEAIALNAVAKFRTRLLPIVHANVRHGRPLPRRTVLALAALLVRYADPAAPRPADGHDVLGRFTAAAATDDPVGRVLADPGLWGEDLTAVPGLVTAVREDIDTIRDRGALAALSLIPR